VAESSSQWHESLLNLGLAASEIPPEVARAVSECQFTAEFAKLLDDFAELEQRAYREAEDEVARGVEEHYGGWGRVKREEATQLSQAWNETARCVLKRHWANYRRGANKQDPSFKYRLPRLKKEAAEWVVQALGAAAQTLWEHKLKHILTTPSEKRLFMSHYTRQQLFAHRILGFDDVLSAFYSWMPIIQECWMVGLVFEPESSFGQDARFLLEYLWRVYVVLYPTRKAQQRARGRDHKQRDRAAKYGERSVSPLDGPSGEQSALEVSADDALEEPSFGRGSAEDAVIDACQASMTLGNIQELASQFLNEKEQQILEAIASDPERTSREIAEYIGLPVEEVYWRRYRMKQKMKNHFSDLDLYH